MLKHAQAAARLRALRRPSLTKRAVHGRSYEVENRAALEYSQPLLLVFFFFPR
jgi:hypothetical protein